MLKGANAMGDTQTVTETEKDKHGKRHKVMEDTETDEDRQGKRHESNGRHEKAKKGKSEGKLSRFESAGKLVCVKSGRNFVKKIDKIDIY